MRLLPKNFYKQLERRYQTPEQGSYNRTSSPSNVFDIHRRVFLWRVSSSMRRKTSIRLDQEKTSQKFLKLCIV
jgi:hypothetical protein